MELVNGVEVIAPLPVLYLRKYRALVFADTHLGYESEMASQGIFIPRFQKKRLMSVLKRSFDLVDVDWVIIAGDLKHKFDGLSRQERSEVREVLEWLLGRVSRVDVVRGNHDNYLPLITKKLGIELVNELLIDDILIVHGHKKPTKDLSKIRLVIIGHEHPSIMLRERLGVVTKLPCFLLGEFMATGTKLVVLPAVGAYQTGSKVTTSPETYLSPILKEMVDLGRLKPFVYDEGIGVLEFPYLKDIEDIIYM